MAQADPNAVLQGRNLQDILRLWEEKHNSPQFDPEPIVTRIAEILEDETEMYMRKDPDPFDERHPSRHYPDCELGRMLKALFRKDSFMNRLVNDYLRDNYFTNIQNVSQSSQKLNIAACRLILVIMPGLDTSAVFQVEFDHLLTRLYSWAEEAEEPLQSYAVGLLGAAMDVQEIAVAFREHNARLLPMALRRLHSLQRIWKGLDPIEGTSAGVQSIDLHDESATLPQTSTLNPNDVVADRPFAHLGGGSAPGSPDMGSKGGSTVPPKMSGIFKMRNSTELNVLSAQNSQHSTQGERPTNPVTMIPFYPPTIESSQRLILRYLTPMGEYQEFLPFVFENNAMQLIFRYIDDIDPKDTCLAFEALKYLSSLLCHKKFTLEFIANGGLDRLLKVPRPSLAATGASVAFYYLAYCEEAMERICLMPQKLIRDLITYELALLGCNHDSGRCHATMFFGLSFQFKIMLDEFDRQDGLRNLVNVIAVLPILMSADDMSLNEDEECAMKQVMRHVCVTLKKYFESHLYYKYMYVTRQENPQMSIPLPTSVLKAPKSSMDVINEQIHCLQETMPMRSHWQPMDEFIRLGGVTMMLRIIAMSYEWSPSRTCTAETVRSSLDVLNVGCVIPIVHQIFCDRIDFPDEASAAGLNIVLGAAEGEIVTDAEVQKSAISVLVNTVCAPIHRVSGSVARYGSAKKKTTNKYSEELIQKVWECVRTNNGIIVLLVLMQTKTPITDADCIRGMACRALAGLARSETVKQIISKLPLFTNGQLQALMRDPILQEKRVEHVQFQKYALELMERVSGRSKPNVANEMDTSLINIHRANIVAQTKIQFNEQQLNQLIFQHLNTRGFLDTAATLLKEAQLKNEPFLKPPPTPLSPFTFRSPASSLVPRSRLRGKVLEHSFQMAASSSDRDIDSSRETIVSELEEPTGSLTPIKLIKKAQSLGSNLHLVHQNQSNHQRSLQKQISAETFLNTAPRSAVTQEERIQPPITLDNIITEFLANQHALCKHPMSTCPAFDLFRPHKCPDPRSNKVFGLSTNFSARYRQRQAGFQSHRLDRRLIHSSFAVTKVIRCSESDTTFTCTDFTPDSSCLVVGLQTGEVKCFAINEGSEEYSYNCHDSNITSVKFNRKGNLLLTSSSWRAPLSALWCVDGRQITPKFQWEDQESCVFSNWVQDRILGTKSEEATIYDLYTCQKISSLIPQNYNQYTRNRAVFDPTDELVLSDGVLWDVRSAKEIHKFDKLNQNLSGVFHPNGLEVVSNTEVWDLRTFHLLRTVPSLEQCQVEFSPMDVMYAISSEVENNIDMENYNSFDSSFKTLDALNYSAISTVDVKRQIYDLSVNSNGLTIAIVENQGGYDSVQESVVRIYAVGCKKSSEDDMEEEDDEPDGSEASDTDNDSDHSDRSIVPEQRALHPRNGNGVNEDEANDNNSSLEGSFSLGDSDSDDSWTTDNDEELDPILGRPF